MGVFYNAETLMAMTAKERLKEGKEDKLAFFKRRLDEMESERTRFETNRDLIDSQYEAEIVEDNFGKILANSKMEQNLVEFELGRTDDSLVFDVEPDGVDVDQQVVKASKHILAAFIDREAFYEEYRRFRRDKAIYGTGVLDCTLHYEVEKVYEDEEKEIDGTIGNGFFDKENINEITKVKRGFTPRNLPLRNFYFDEKAMYQSDFMKAVDCIKVDTLALDKFLLYFGENKNFDQEAVVAVTETQDYDVDYNIQSDDGHVLVYSYYNRITKDFIIVANQEHLLLATKMKYKHGKLPFILAQQYPKHNLMYGVGIPEKVRFEKGYENVLHQALLDGAVLSSGKVLITSPQGGPVDGQIDIIPGGVTMAEFTDTVNGYNQIDTNVNMNGLIAALDTVVEKNIRRNTGINIEAAFEEPEETLGQTEIKEENKAIRQKAVDTALLFALDNALTLTLWNIKQFAPTLLATTTKILDGKKYKKDMIQRPMIQIKDVKVKKKGKQQIVEKDMGEYGYLELKPETLDFDLRVRVVTPATNNNTLKAIQQNRTKEMIGNIVELLNAGFQPELVFANFPPEEVMRAVKLAYGYGDKLSPETKKSKKRKENMEKVTQMQDMLASIGGGGGQDLSNNVNNEQPTNQQTQEAGQQPTEIIGGL